MRLKLIINGKLKYVFPREDAHRKFIEEFRNSDRHHRQRIGLRIDIILHRTCPKSYQIQISLKSGQTS